eukprot:6475870-Amphidinium_carterae.1
MIEPLFANQKDSEVRRASMDNYVSGRTTRYWRKKTDLHPQEDELPEPEAEKVASSTCECSQDSVAALQTLQEETRSLVALLPYAEAQAADAEAKLAKMTDRLNFTKALCQKKVQAKKEIDDALKKEERLGSELRRKLDDAVVLVSGEGCSVAMPDRCTELAAVEEKLRLQEEAVQHLRGCIENVREERCKIECRQRLQSLAMMDNFSTA